MLVLIPMFLFNLPREEKNKRERERERKRRRDEDRKGEAESAKNVKTYAGKLNQ